jgi:hypothetical protein
MLGYSILIFLLTERIINAYRDTGFTGFEGEYYLIAIGSAIAAAKVFLILGAILTGIVSFVFNKNKESRIPFVFSLAGGVIWGILYFFLDFGFETFLTPAIFTVGS